MTDKLTKKYSISVGIPAYNEGANIGNLLKSVLFQTDTTYDLLEVIVISDGSQDNTINEVLKLDNKKIRLVVKHPRKGKTQRLNDLLEFFRGDVLILLDADIKISNKSLFESILANIDLDTDGLIGINSQPIKDNNFFPRVLNYSVYVQSILREKWNKGVNYLSFSGSCLVLSKKLAKKIVLPSDLVNNDAYLYFKAKKEGYEPKYLPHLSVYFKSPRNFSDHLKQSSRFQMQRQELSRYFQEIEDEYKIPKKLVILSVINLLKNPIYGVSYLIISLLTILKKNKNIVSTWVIAESTKN